MSLNIIQNIRDGVKRAHPIRYFLAKILVKTGLCAIFIINRDGYKLRFYPSNISVKMYVEGPLYLRDDELIIKKFLEEGDIYVDVGANVGHLLFTAKSVVGSKGVAIGVEPHPRIFRYLAANATLNRADVDLKNVAVGSSPGSVNFSDGHSDDMNAVLAAGSGITVEMQTLDQLLKDVPRIDLLKIDVEGYELEVLKGAEHVLNKTRLVYFESYMELAEKFGYRTGDIIKLLVGKGFSVFQSRQGGWRQVDPDHVSKNWENLLAARGPEIIQHMLETDVGGVEAMLP